MQQRVLDRFLRTLEHLEYGSLTLTTPDGKTHSLQGNQPGAHGTLHLHDWRTLPALSARGDIGLAEAYRDGWWDSEHLESLFLVGLQNAHALEPFMYGNAFTRLAARMLYLFTRNSLRGSRKNIHAHYDLGNAFYSLWLDPSMSYSAALFSGQNETLEQAQYRKYDRMLDRLDTSSGHVLEIGCGWGALAERATQKHDFAVRGITLSEEQHAYATQRLQGVGAQAQIVLEDYRHQHGRFDHIISIEMFEAVGESYWPTYFNKLKSLLKEKGKAMVQTITIGDAYFDAYRSSGDMIRTFIFPGGMLPSPSRFATEAERAGLRPTDRFSFGQDYARTLRHWLAAFDARKQDVLALGFDEPFIRLWRFYLASCSATFASGRTDVMQWELQHA